MNIEIFTSSDDHDCEACGGSWTDGGVVYVDGEKVLEREPFAYCYGFPSFNKSDLLVMALKKMGHSVIVDGSQYGLSSHDDEYNGYKLEDS